MQTFNTQRRLVGFDFFSLFFVYILTKKTKTVFMFFLCAQAFLARWVKKGRLLQ